MINSLLILIKCFAVAIVLILFFIVTLRIATFVRRRQLKLYLRNNQPLIGFFHPAADACGGGEKVLFQAISALQNAKKFDTSSILVYSGSKKPAE